jgi:hypothetical protein
MLSVPRSRGRVTLRGDEKQDIVKPDEHLASAHMKQFSVLDLDGNRITFAEPLA